jgi:hypothetical protein
VLLVQSQHLQKDPAAYAALIEGAKAQQDPGAGQALWAGLTTAFATADQMVAAYRAVADDVTGFWVTIYRPEGGAPQTAVAAEFFRQALA